MELPEFVYVTMNSLLLRGNAYGLITARSGPGMLPAQVELLNPDRVSVRVNPESGRVVYNVLGREVDRSDIWHARAYVQPGWPQGLSPIQYAKQSIGLGLATEEFGARFFGDGASPSGILTSALPLGEDQAKLAVAKWGAKHGDRKRKTAYLPGDVKWQQITIAPEESQMIESQRLNVSTIARLFNVPPELIAGEAGNSLTYANVTNQAVHFHRFSLQPWISRIERALSRLIPSRQYVKLNPDTLLRSTTTERFNAYKVALDAGFMTVNEIRALEDLPPRAETTTPTSPATNGARDEIGAIQ
jgi:HK97 family phage portal protein